MEVWEAGGTTDLKQQKVCHFSRHGTVDRTTMCLQNELTVIHIKLHIQIKRFGGVNTRAVVGVG
jgi:hypothetical protein